MKHNIHVALVAVSSSELLAQVTPILAAAGIEDVHAAHSMEDGVNLMLQHEFSLFVIDAQLLVLSQEDKIHLGGVDFVKFIRMCEGPVSEAHIVFLRSETKIQNLIEANAEIMEARDGGASCIIARPITVEKFQETVAPMLAGNRAFIRARGYSGPCRRHLDRPMNFERRANSMPRRRQGRFEH